MLLVQRKRPPNSRTKRTQAVYISNLPRCSCSAETIYRHGTFLSETESAIARCPSSDNASECSERGSFVCRGPCTCSTAPVVRRFLSARSVVPRSEAMFVSNLSCSGVQQGMRSELSQLATHGSPGFGRRCAARRTVPTRSTRTMRWYTHNVLKTAPDVCYDLARSKKTASVCQQATI